ncbi:MAG TPA: efflux RND transporter periplasmic adaptor subunit [Terriglobales bacterium]|nr:efflux RND transporter periplasmic adaptor subunit [Terriglobales bacterium]
MKRFWIVFLPLLAAAGVVTGFYVVRASDRRAIVPGGTIVHAERRTVTTLVNATGTVRLRVGSEVRVGSQLSGIVKKLNVTVGSHVRAGEVIAEIDDATIQARLSDAEAQGELDRSGMERARVNYERAQKLAAQGLIPLQQEQDLRLALEESEAKYQKSLRDRDLVRVDLNYVDIRAPIGGTVASVSTQEGETVAASFTAPTFVTIIGDEALQLVAMVDETDIANVRPGDPATFTVDSYPAREFPGTAVSIAPKATIVSGVVNYEVTINIQQGAALLKPDMTANVSIQTAQHEALLVPAGVVQQDGGQSFVYVPGKTAAEKKPIVIGAKDGVMVEVKRGVSASDDILLPANNPQPGLLPEHRP